MKNYKTDFYNNDEKKNNTIYDTMREKEKKNCQKQAGKESFGLISTDYWTVSDDKKKKSQ